ncbi:ABC transporter permease [Cohnella massiliensis]|uniref:ABC transporter permease n=1 Tax=Cohnella massiliensis TaxID=1816691 RepID=UPI0009BBF014|nr:ABC transporter permease [Cohnella massiliensis]
MFKKAKEIYAYRQMLESLVLTDLRTRYKGSFLGFFWTLLNPLLMLLVYSIVFKFVVRIEMDNYTAYLFIGLISWNILSQSITAGSSAVIRNAGLVKKIYFPKEILPLAVVSGGFINYFFSLIILIPILLIAKVQVGLPLLLLPLVLLIYFIFTLSLALLISGLNVYFRDLEHIMGILVMVWFYLTPIVFPSNMIPEEIGYIFDYNPMRVIIESFQQIFFYNQYPNAVELLVVALLSIVLLILSLKVFKKLSRHFAEEI